LLIDFGSIKKIHVQNGDFVKKGDLLIEQYANCSDDEVYQEKRKELEDLKGEYEYVKTNEPDPETLAELEAEIAELEKWLMDNNDSDYNKVYAQVSGTVQDIPEELPGEDMRGKTVHIMNVIDYSQMTLLYEGSYAREFVKDLEVEIRDKDPNSDLVVKATVVQVENDYKEGTYFAIADEDRGKLRVGKKYSVTGNLYRSEGVIVIPKELPKKYQGRSYVEVLLPDGTKESRIIELGLADEINVEVKSGLAAGDVIIVR
ncbi:MAG TPA: hypothetical protein PLZ84_01975, partial [Clostridia bacterium]|nr:hypothetical protein [Clostridia bacterium]